MNYVTNDIPDKISSIYKDITSHEDIRQSLRWRKYTYAYDSRH